MQPLDWRINVHEDEYEGGDIHCIPNNDLHEHIEEPWCACSPEVIDETEGGRVLMHNAYDEREVIEQLFQHYDD